jgi:hypothetical protein
MTEDTAKDLTPSPQMVDGALRMAADELVPFGFTDPIRNRQMLLPRH